MGWECVRRSGRTGQGGPFGWYQAPRRLLGTVSALSLGCTMVPSGDQIYSGPLTGTLCIATSVSGGIVFQNGTLTG